MKAVRLYAQVLVDVAHAPQSGFSLDQVIGELKEFVGSFAESPKLLMVFDSPTISEDEKLKVLKELASRAKMSPLTERFLSLLAKRSRLGILIDILKEVEVMQLEKSGGILGELTSAIPLDAGVAQGVAQALSKKLNKPVQLKERVDPGIIAGMRVTIGGVTYDGSVKSKLDKLVGSFR